MLARWVAWCLRRGRLVLALSVLVAVFASGLAWHGLGFNLDPNALFSDDLPFQQRIQRFAEHFPVLTNSMFVVVDGERPEAVRDIAEALAARLKARPELFHDVYFPGEESFFETRGLLYVSLEDLDTFTENLARLQPLVAELSVDPSIATLAWVVEKALGESPVDEDDTELWTSALDHFRNAVVSVYEEFPLRVSWESVLLDGTALDPTRQRVIVVEPELDFDRILAAERPIEAVREEAAALAPGRQGVRVRLTGYPVLNHEEFLGLARDTGLAGLLSFVLIVGILWVAFHSWRIVAAAAGTLVLGFLWTAGYAALAVGRLNPVSIAFAVLFLGLGIDFTIHLGMGIVATVRAGGNVAQGAVRAARHTGTALILCAATTAIGFLAFLPTDYRGVTELGVISAGGMVVIVFLTLSVFPVLVARGLDRRERDRVRARRAVSIRIPAPRHPRLVVAGTVALAIAAGATVPYVRLETNVVALRNPDTESVQTFLDLLDSERGTPWYLDALAPDLDRAEALAHELDALPEVRTAITLRDYVPRHQEEKLDMLSDLALMLDVPPAGDAPRHPATVEAQLDALRDLVRVLDAPALAAASSDLARSARLLRDKLRELIARVEADPEPAAALNRLQDELLGGLPALLDRLQRSFEVEPVTLADLPPNLVRRMVAPDGRARVQVFPAEDLGEPAAMQRFVQAVRAHWTEITGLPVNLVDSGAVTWRSLREAVVFAVLAISLLLLALWRRPGDVVIAVAPLLVAVLVTAATNVWLGISINFVDICVLPLILGIGADSGIHLVHRARAGGPDERALLESTTARAVFYSALTTLASFGTLLVSDHRGIATLGELLLIGMLLTLAANLVVLPSLLALRRRRADAASAAPADAP